jgi:hypothetical protein
MPWHEPRLTGAFGEPTVRERQRKLNQGREFLPERRDTATNEFNFNEAILIDHLVRPCEHILRNRETDLLGGFHMYHPAPDEEIAR